MGVKSFLSRVFAAWAGRQIDRVRQDSVALQRKMFQELIAKGQFTAFGKDHHFSAIRSYEDFRKYVPVREYEDLQPYLQRVLHGEPDVLWPGRPAYIAKTSGTTSGIKYVPISRESMPEHIRAARNALLNYIRETGRSDFADGKMIFLQGSPLLREKSGIPTGRLSGIVANLVPRYLQGNRLPSYAVNCIDDWEQKLDAIVDETIGEDMRLISGIPPWCQMYFERLSARSGGKKIRDIFPNFKLFVYGGVNYEPYRARLEESIGFPVDSIETYPASEGFIAYQDSQQDKSLLLLTDAGMFYEFIPQEEYFAEKCRRLSLEEVELGRNYALVISTTAGLWAYSIGDTVRFVSKNPYRILVSGRIKHYISAFGEHVIGEEVEDALMSVARSEGVHIAEFTVAPQVSPPGGQLPFHEWFIEFGSKPADLQEFALKVDRALQNKNIYYFDLIAGRILQPLIIRSLKKNAFIDYMRSAGRLGGQNKVPRLSNDRRIAEALNEYVE